MSKNKKLPVPQGNGSYDLAAIVSALAAASAQKQEAGINYLQSPPAPGIGVSYADSDAGRMKRGLAGYYQNNPGAVRGSPENPFGTGAYADKLLRGVANRRHDYQDIMGGTRPYNNPEWLAGQGQGNPSRPGAKPDSGGDLASVVKDLVGYKGEDTGVMHGPKNELEGFPGVDTGVMHGPVNKDLYGYKGVDTGAMFGPAQNTGVPLGGQMTREQWDLMSPQQQAEYRNFKNKESQEILDAERVAGQTPGINAPAVENGDRGIFGSAGQILGQGLLDLGMRINSGLFGMSDEDKSGIRDWKKNRRRPTKY